MIAIAEGIVAISIALCFLAIPVWLLSRLSGRRRMCAGGSEDDKQKIEHLLGLAETMEARLVTLEAILDKQHPNWRREL